MAFLAHEFGHVEDAERIGGTLWQKQDRLLDQHNQGYEKQGQAWLNTTEYKQIVSQLGGTPVSIHEQRETRAERATIPVLQDYYAQGAGHGTMPRRVNQAIRNYQKAHP